MDGPTSRQSIEQQFARAQELGRWLTDDELAAEDEQESLRLAEAQKRKSLRTRLIVLTAVCVVLPPLWPLACFDAVLLFPNTSSRLFLAAGVGVILAVLAGLGLSVWLLIWLLSILFEGVWRRLNWRGMVGSQDMQIDELAGARALGE